MDVFELRETVVAEYSAYTKSFLRIDDAQINDFVHAELARRRLWPDPLVQLNPAFEPGETVAALAADEHGGGHGPDADRPGGVFTGQGAGHRAAQRAGGGGDAGDRRDGRLRPP